jgi:thiosulfate dehydrogenase
VLALISTLSAAACGQENGPQGAGAARLGSQEGAPSTDLLRAALVPATATLETLDSLPMDPRRFESPQPDLPGADDLDPHLRQRVLEGYRIGRETSRLAPEFVGNDLSCFNCHLNGGQRERALPLVGVAATFPQYRGRNAEIVSLYERIAGCFRRSMNGTPPPEDHPVALALVAYISWISTGQPMGVRPDWLGQNRLPEAARIAMADLDPERGERLYAQQCAACHGLDGQGVALPQGRPGPLWGPRSWNDGAGAARPWTLAGFIRWAMPLTAPGSLSDRDAQDIAAWINSHERPEFPTRAADYPAGGRPGDAVYDTLVFPVHPFRGVDRPHP